MRIAPLLPCLALAAVLSACASTRFDPETGLYAEPVGGAPATANPTPMTPALICLADTARSRGLIAPRLAVGGIDDLTGKLDLETGRRITQGAALFAVTALGRAGVPLVERTEQDVATAERAYAQARVLSDTPAAPGEAPGPVRPVNPGQIAGSRYYLVGGVTELNYNIESSGGELGVGALDPEDAKTGVGGSRFVMNVAIDLRLVDSISQEVVAVAAYQKQIVGREIRAGVFDILGGVAIDLSGGVSALEPLQLGVRSLIEQGAYDLAVNLYGMTDAGCAPATPGVVVAGGYSALRSLQAPGRIAPPPPPAPVVETYAGSPVQAPVSQRLSPPPAVLAREPVPYGVSGPIGPIDGRPAPWSARARLDPGTWRLTRPPAN